MFLQSLRLPSCWDLVVQNPPDNIGDMGDVGLIPELGRSLRGGNGNPLQYSCLGNPRDRGAWSLWSHVMRSTFHHWN